ncbi:MAG: COX15/CtaA family protein [Ideonella sp.]|nr:COX15/CtaA family protein [Ideonella sp.]
MDATPLVDLTPIARIAMLGILIALGPLVWVWWRYRAAGPVSRLRALTLVTLFLTFDLVLFGVFTRLSDSGLGCPDWPGCYGSVSPIGAREEIHAAQTAQPTGPVTHGKAWIEMIHRYLATGVGVLISVLAIASWVVARRGQAAISPWWATVTWVWVCVQGAFGAFTVTMKLYPAIVTLHLLGGLFLLVLLAAQAEAYERRPLRLPRATHVAAVVVAVLSTVQIALGGWVSTNYAVLACTDFPTCHGRWWPEMDFVQGFAIFRELGAAKGGEGYLPFAALTAIHVAHRLGALVVFIAMAVLAVMLWRDGGAACRRWAMAVVGVAAWQFATGLSNVVLGWPLLAALGHSAGAAALVVGLSVLLARAHHARRATGAIPVAAGAAGAPRSGARRPLGHSA